MNADRINKDMEETKISREIRILAEVEKIWIIFDCDNSGYLEKKEIKLYLKFMSTPKLDIDDQYLD